MPSMICERHTHLIQITTTRRTFCARWVNGFDPVISESKRSSAGSLHSGIEATDRAGGCGQRRRLARTAPVDGRGQLDISRDKELLDTRTILLGRGMITLLPRVRCRGEAENICSQRAISF